MRRPADEPDTDLWERATRDVIRLRPSPALPSAPRRPAVEIGVARDPGAAGSRPAAPPSRAPLLALDRFAGIDRANAERLKRGRHPIEARLDLHGLTQIEAYRVLGGFIRGARAGGKRCVLVITGRGNFGDGVLRAAVPRWLAEAELRPHLLAIATAQPRDGGAGALYVMLRRNATVER